MSKYTGTKLARTLEYQGLGQYGKRDVPLISNERKLFKVHELLPPVLLAPGQSYNVEKALKRAGYRVFKKGDNIIRVIKA